MVKQNARSTAKEFRRIDGEDFQGVGEWDSKAHVQKLAANRRERGYKARVVKHKTGYVLYIKTTKKVKYPLAPGVWKV